MSDQTEPDSPDEQNSAETAEQNSAETPKRNRPAKKAVKAKGRPDAVPPTSNRGPLLIAAATGLVAGLVGGAAVAALWHPSSGGSGKFSSQQVDGAKKDVCDAVVLARQAVAANMHMRNPDPENPIAQLAVAANARLSLTAGAAYLRGRLVADPATPQEIVDTTREMASALERLNLSYLVGQPNSEREQLGHDLDSHITELGKLCQ